MIEAHGKNLVNRTCTPQEREERLKAACQMPVLDLTSSEVSDIYMIGTGAYSPLKGFMDSADYQGVVEGMCLKNGVLWPIPVTLAVTEEEANNIKPEDEIALRDPASGELVATITVSDLYRYDKEKEALATFGTLDTAHPGVKKLFEQKAFYVGGEICQLADDTKAFPFPEYAGPAKVRQEIAERGWKTVAAFQTRNPIHRSHEYLTKIAMEVCDGVLIHPVVGKLKEGDIPADVRLACYRALLQDYYPAERTLLRVYPMEMRYAGPKEALLHAIVRQNFGCTHIIIGRDHAGVGKYYGPFDAQNIFDNLSESDLLIKPLKFDWTFWCKRCGGMASTKTCPHSAEDHVAISGTKLRTMLAEGKRIPEEFTRPEVAEILAAYYLQL